MKNFKKYVLILFAAIAMIVSCAKVDEAYYNTSRLPVNSKGEYAILFNNAATKASVTSLSGTNYDEFNLYVWNSNNDTIMNPYRVNATTSGYIYEGINSQELKYFSRTASSYDFIGIIPTNHTEILNNGSVKVEGLQSFVVDDNRVTGTITADSPEEFLYSYTNVEKSEYGSVVTLPFEHGNSLLYLGFSSDRDDTEIINYVPAVPAIPATPDVNDTTDTWFNLKRSSNVDGSATKLKGPGESSYTANVALPASLVSEIKSYYSINGGTAGDYNLNQGSSAWPSNEIRTLRVVKNIPDNYKLVVERTDGKKFTFFDGFKYLKDNGYDIQPKDTGGKPAIWDYILLDAYVNGSAYTVVGFNWAIDKISAYVNNAWDYNYPTVDYTIVITPGSPAVPGRDAIEGIRVFSADSTSTYCIHIPHTTVADANVSSLGMTYDNRTTSDDVVTFSLPVTTTLSSTPVWSATTFYALPGDTDLNFFVVKLSYIYNGVTAYDVRVPIKLPDGGLQPGKYYKYEIYITSTSNGTNDADEATNEKDEIIIEGLPPIIVNLSVQDYTQGANQKITI